VVAPSAAASGLPPLPPLVLEVENLAAARGLRVLFEGLSVSLAAGDILELRGPNGAGKSTLLRILAGLTRPLAGEVRFVPRREAGAGRSGDDPDDRDDPPRHYLGHADAIKPNESAGEQARFWARFFGHDDKAGSQALERIGLASRRDVPGRGLSAGQRRRLALARLLIDPRPIWLLDEPVAALDTEGRLRVEELVAKHAADGGITVVAMHGEGFPGARTLDIAGFAPRYTSAEVGA
jgi:heme exporter protein A